MQRLQVPSFSFPLLLSNFRPSLSSRPQSKSHAVQPASFQQLHKHRPWAITLTISCGLKPNSVRGKGRWFSWSIRKAQHLVGFHESAGASVRTSGSQASLPRRHISLWFWFVVVVVLEEEGQILEKKHSSGH